jgi:hypothetical protein
MLRKTDGDTALLNGSNLAETLIAMSIADVATVIAMCVAEIPKWRPHAVERGNVRWASEPVGC